MRSTLVLLVAIFYVVAADLTGEQPSREGKQYNYYYPGAAAVQPGYNYGYHAADPRLFLRQTVTTTTTSTSTSTFTCTKSVANACAGGRKRRGILLDEDNEEQFIVSPTIVQGSEASQDPIRESREASPQLLMYPPDLAQYHLQSGYDQYYNYVPLNYYYNPLNVGASPNNRFLFGLAANVISQFITTTTLTSTVFTFTTSTSTPTCSTAGAIAQCPNA